MTKSLTITLNDNSMQLKSCKLHSRRSNKINNDEIMINNNNSGLIGVL